MKRYWEWEVKDEEWVKGNEEGLPQESDKEEQVKLKGEKRRERRRSRS